MYATLATMKDIEKSHNTKSKNSTGQAEISTSHVVGIYNESKYKVQNQNMGRI